MITVEEHRERVLSLAERLPTEAVALRDARGRCLAESVVARTPVPPWTNSAMDGYAVRFDDVARVGPESPVKLRVIADLPAGTPEDPEIRSGEAARIMTGAPVPGSADTVVPQEMTDCGTETVLVREVPARGRHIRHAGEDRAEGEVIAGPGFALTPEALAAIASAGHGEVRVMRLPRVAVISTGNELVAPGSELSRGQIPDSNALLLSFLCEDAGAPATLAHAGDDPEDLARTIGEHTSSCDVVVMTGGVSVGAFDPVKTLFSGNADLRFDRVAMQPGKPQAIGRLGGDGPLIFGLPGNPVSAWVSFQMFARPALRKMQGFRELLPPAVPARATADWETPRGRVQVIPVRIRDGETREVLPAAAGGSGSHLIASLAQADGYALVEADTERVRAGDLVRSVRLRDPEQFNQRRRSS